MTALLLVIWGVFTFGAQPMTPVVIAVAERVESHFGLDRSVGPETD